MKSSLHNSEKVHRRVKRSASRPTRNELEAQLRCLRDELASDQDDLELDALRRAQQELEEAHHHYADLYDFAPVGYLALDRNGCIRTINVTGALLLGQERVDLVGRPLLPLVARPDRRKFLGHLSRLRRGQSQVTTELQIAGRRQRPIPTQLISVCDGTDRFASAQFRTAIVDLTERKRTEQALHESEERLRCILDTALDAVVTINAEGTITDWNSQAEHIFGWAKAEVVGKKLVEIIIPAEYREAHERGMRHYFKTGVGPL